MKSVISRIESSANYIRSKTSAKPLVGIILGSGLGDFAQTLEKKTCIPFESIPGFPVSSVAGHTGMLVIGEHNGQVIAAMCGRSHYYEGCSQMEITIPIRVLHRIGAKSIILTNAAGGINLDFSAGALMIITDHINYSGHNPLIGSNFDDFGPRFPDMSDLYTKEIRDEIKARASINGIILEEGVYAMYSGPSYETPAEIKMLRVFGADAVGMSTVPEAIVAKHAGMKVVGISCITNMAAGVLDKKLSHEEVVDTATKVRDAFTKVISIAIAICGEKTFEADKKVTEYISYEQPQVKPSRLVELNLQK